MHSFKVDVPRNPVNVHTHTQKKTQFCFKMFICQDLQTYFYYDVL